MSDLNIAALSVWLTSIDPKLSGPIAARKFPGGQSNPTYRMDIGDRSLVLRRKPFGKLLPSAHAVDREYRVMAALHPTGFPVPKPLALCLDEQPIGSIFYIMEFVDGRTFGDGGLPEIARAERRPIYNAMIDALAQLHALDPAAVGLDDFGRPGNYLERQVRRWSGQYRASQTDDIEEVEFLIDFLSRDAPQQSGTSVIHGDFRIDNLVYDSAKPRVIAVLDWELSTLGDPIADFAYFAMHWVMPKDGRSGLMGIDLEQEGIPGLEEVIARYCAASGRKSLPELHWYFAYNLFRLIAILQGVKRRMLDGNASNANAQDSVSRIPALAAIACQQAQRARSIGSAKVQI